MCAIVRALFGLCGFKVRALGKFLQCSSYTLSHLPISILLFLIAEMANKWLLHCEVEDGHMCTYVCMRFLDLIHLKWIIYILTAYLLLPFAEKKMPQIFFIYFHLSVFLLLQIFQCFTTCWWSNLSKRLTYSLFSHPHCIKHLCHSICLSIISLTHSLTCIF